MPRSAAAGPQTLTAQQFEGTAERDQRIAAGRRSGRNVAEPRGLAVPHGEGGGLPAPMNDQRDQDRPFSADSSRNVPGRLPANLA